MWSQKPITVDRQQNKGPIFLPRPFLAVVGAIQPGVLPEVTANRDDGMLDRFLLAYPDPVPDHWSDEEISVEAEVGVGRVYARLHDLPAGEDDQGDPKPVPVDLSPEARDIFKAQVNALGREKREPGFPETLQGPWAKWAPSSPASPWPARSRRTRPNGWRSRTWNAR